MTPADKLLPRLGKVRQVRAGQWVACCPAHDDKSPSLRITEADDGKLLVKCWAGCAAKSICHSVGLEVRDLFSDDGYRPRHPGPSRKALLFEGMVYRIGQAHQAQGMALSPEDQARFEQAKQRLGVVL
jgi:hypothetical protein